MIKKEDSVNIRHADSSDIVPVMDFLREHWGKDHVMANHRALMEYEHFWLDKFTYVIAEDRHTGKIYGLCGYLPYSKESCPDIGAGIWKVIQSPRFMLGIEIMKFVQKETNCRMLACCGVNQSTKGHRKLLGHFYGKLKHFYRLHQQKSEYQVAIIRQKPNLYSTEGKESFVELTSMEELKRSFDITKYKEIMPYRDYSYLAHRYYDHIKYQYTVLGIKTETGIEAIVIGRGISCEMGKVFRIVDFIGEESAFSGTNRAWEEFLNKNDYEYVDFYEYGLSDAVLEAAGFSQRTKEDSNIIPNYFEPFEQKNVEIYFSANVSEGFRMFKGDADQDRPNQM